VPPQKGTKRKADAPPQANADPHEAMRQIKLRGYIVERDAGGDKVYSLGNAGLAEMSTGGRSGAENLALWLEGLSGAARSAGVIELDDDDEEEEESDSDGIEIV